MRRSAAISLLCVLLAAGCRAAPAPTATPLVQPATATAPARTPTPSPGPARSPVTTPGATATPGQVVEGDGFTITLPADWIALRLDSAGAADAFKRFESSNPDLAAALGGPEALQDAAFWAFAPIGDDGFTDNLNLRRLPWEGRQIAEMSRVIAALEEQYRQFSFTILESDTARTIDGKPAAYLQYQYELATQGAPGATVTGHQYLIAAGKDLWILSFSAGPQSKEDSARVFARVAETFTVVDQGV